MPTIAGLRDTRIRRVRWPALLRIQEIAFSIDLTALAASGRAEFEPNILGTAHYMLTAHLFAIKLVNIAKT